MLFFLPIMLLFYAHKLDLLCFHSPPIMLNCAVYNSQKELVDKQFIVDCTVTIQKEKYNPLGMIVAA